MTFHLGRTRWELRMWGVFQIFSQVRSVRLITFSCFACYEPTRVAHSIIFIFKTQTQHEPTVRVLVTYTALLPEDFSSGITG